MSMFLQKRDGNTVPFDAMKIRVAIEKAFLKDAEGNPRSGAEGSAAVKAKSAEITDAVVVSLEKRGGDGTYHIEDVQDQVELALMRAGEHKIARDYVLYREGRAKERQSLQPSRTQVRSVYRVVSNGLVMEISREEVEKSISNICDRFSVDSSPVVTGLEKLYYEEMPLDELEAAKILAAKPLVERDFGYSYVAAQFLIESTKRAAYKLLGLSESDGYSEYLARYIRHGIQVGRLDPKLADFDLEEIGSAIEEARDWNFTYQGAQILYDRYLLHDGGVRFELPQAMWMRVAMGLSLNEISREKWAKEFYRVLSTFSFVSSTPTLFNAGTTHPQLSSCFLTTVPDDLNGIYDAIKENALLSKYSGGLGNDWTPVRAMGSYIKGTNGKSQGVVPFLKVVNDTAVAVNQGGKRKGAVCAYLETWHLDIEEFLELRKNTGDDRRRTHDMNTANWIPDLFMERVDADAEWTLFSPSDVPDLHDLTGAAFRTRYEEYEEQALTGKIELYKRVPAVQLWRKMLTMLFETGHPWITFKDPCNLRNPQQHVGVVHSSNLCTEITLNSTPDGETAVCNLGSINLMRHLETNPVKYAEGDELLREDWPKDQLREEMSANEVFRHLDSEGLKDTVTIAMRMLDNVIDLNFYPTRKARNANLRHRAVGLGIMGFADALHALQIPMDSQAAVQFADSSQEVISYLAIESSVNLAKERGSYASFEGSLWSKGVLPIDSIRFLEESRGYEIPKDMGIAKELWNELRESVKNGMRNSNCMAIAPTATISNIAGVSQGIDPIYQNLYVKSNLSGEFTVVDQQMFETLEKLELWDDVMVNDLKYFDGSLKAIDRVPDWAKRLYATAFEIDPIWLVRMAAARQKWVDQSISLNLYMAQPSGKKIDDLYRAAWRSGLKTTYYLRTLGATSAEKSTVDRGVLNAVSGSVKACAIDDPDCEACQ